MKKNFVSQKDINLVIDGLNKYFQRMTETHSFNPIEMKQFMEPIFTEAGYRRSTVGERNRVENILITHIAAGVGDLVFMSPAIREIRRTYPEAHITLIVYDRAGNLAELCPYVNEIIVDVRRCDWKNLLSFYIWYVELAKKLLLRRYDMVFPLAGYPSAFLLAYMSGAQKIFSFKPVPNKHFIEPLGPEVYEPFMYILPKPNPGFVETSDFSRYLSLLDSLTQYPVQNREGEIWLGGADRSFARDILSADISKQRKIYALCMGGTKMSKMWPPHNYARLAMTIVDQDPNVKFVILGGGKIDAWSAQIFKQTVGEEFFAEHVIDLTNKATYRQSAAIIELADMYIGNDTGTMHMASTVKIPVLSMNCFAADLPFENSIPATCYPYHVPTVIVQPEHALQICRYSKDRYGCLVSHTPHCILQITVNTVFEAYKTLQERIAQNNIEPLFIS